MILDRTHRRWIVAVVLLTVAATAVYVPYARQSAHGPSGSSAIGLVFGITGSALMLFAGLFGARKKVPTWRLGRAETWLKGHIWLGLLAVPLILFHSGFAFGGTLTTLLMVLFYLEIASGIFGLVLQQVLPKMILERVPRETIFEQIDRKIEFLVKEADERVEQVAGTLGVESPEVAMVAAGARERSAGGFDKSRLKTASTPVAAVPQSEPLRDFYLSEVRPFLLSNGKLTGPLANDTEAKGRFRNVRLKVPSTLHETISEIEDICKERQEYELQRKIHFWLHGWLWVHVPISMALLVLAAFHAVMALKF
ncbi:MAG: hypothetical protein HYR85_13385 [Planctomycetes bacterium]|nr:hypothetical protein [Planctomycetota bacterium]